MGGQSASIHDDVSDWDYWYACTLARTSQLELSCKDGLDANWDGQ